jgi:hypothetical protein
VIWPEFDLGTTWTHITSTAVSVNVLDWSCKTWVFDFSFVFPTLSISDRENLFWLYMWTGHIMFQKAVLWSSPQLVSFYFVIISSCVVIISSCSMLHSLHIDEHILSSSYIYEYSIAQYSY